MSDLRPDAGVAVLVVEDDDDIRDTLAEVLTEEGYAVATARNGAHALSVLETVTPKVILLDLHMPVMDGREFREAQKRDPELIRIPTVVLTAADRLQREVSELGVADAVAKPIELPELLSVVERYCR